MSRIGYNVPGDNVVTLVYKTSTAAHHNVRITLSSFFAYAPLSSHLAGLVHIFSSYHTL
jgi:hypothetical protein